MTKVRQTVKEIYREVELCPKCGKLMELNKGRGVIMTYPPKYSWDCPSCQTTISSFNSGEVRYVFNEPDQ